MDQSLFVKELVAEINHRRKIQGESYKYTQSADGCEKGKEVAEDAAICTTQDRMQGTVQLKPVFRKTYLNDILCNNALCVLFSKRDVYCHAFCLQDGTVARVQGLKVC